MLNSIRKKFGTTSWSVKVKVGQNIIVECKEEEWKWWRLRNLVKIANRKWKFEKQNSKIRRCTINLLEF